MDNRVFYCTEFKGHWPVSACAVVVALNKGEARELLYEELERHGLKQKDKIKLVDIIEIPLNKTAAYITVDGTY